MCCSRSRSTSAKRHSAWGTTEAIISLPTWPTWFTIGDLSSGTHQLKAMIDLCHLYGIAVVLDVVYNHAGGFEGDDAGLYFWDRVQNGNNNNSLYFTDRGWAGGLSFALWNQDVRQFVINNAGYY